MIGQSRPALNHPHVAAIYGLEERDGSPFLVLELVEGEDLAERLKRGPIPIEEALEIARQTAEAFEKAHEKGIVHRDPKPANVKLTPDGEVKVLDFGLAKAYADDAVPNRDPAERQWSNGSFGATSVDPMEPAPGVARL